MGSSTLGVVVPVGPHEDPSDTVNSVLRYSNPGVRVVLVDDTGGGLRQYSSAATSEAHGTTNVCVVTAPREAPGGFGGLWVKVCVGIAALLEGGVPDVILRMDTDALMLAAGIEDAAREVLREQPNAGILGAVRFGPDGGRRDWRPGRDLLRSDTTKGLLRHPRLALHLRHLVTAARTHGYTPGEHALGGAYIMSPTFATWLRSSGELDNRIYRDSSLGEDHLCGLLARAGGFELGEFSRPGDPLAVSWRGLPFHPDRLLSEGVCVTHSVRFFESLDERAIRSIFASRRATSPTGDR